MMKASYKENMQNYQHSIPTICEIAEYRYGRSAQERGIMAERNDKNMKKLLAILMAVLLLPAAAMADAAPHSAWHPPSAPATEALFAIPLPAVSLMVTLFNVIVPPSPCTP